MSSQPKTSAGATGPPAGKTAAAERQERLAQALRDNLKKRKAQQRQRREARPGSRDGGAEGGES